MNFLLRFVLKNTHIKTMKNKFYAVAKGRETGVFESWEACKKHVHKFTGAVFKSFPTHADALRFVDAPRYSSHMAPSSSKVTKASGVPPKAIKRTEMVDRGLASLKTQSSNGSSQTIVRSGIAIVQEAKQTIVYTDGSCLGNGGKGAKAGVGVYFGNYDPRFS
jgi:ribonuclease HI